jgi:hypothetical protein
MNGEARWLAVRVAHEAEQPRVLLLSVPYAIKAADAESLGGLPPSAFVLANTPNVNAPSTGTNSAKSAQPPATGTTPVTTGGGKGNQLTKFDAAADITSSIITDTGTNVGVGTTAPATTLDVKGAATVRGTLILPATGTATATVGNNSQPLNMTASAFNSSKTAAVNQTFQWKAMPTGNNSASPGATLNLLFGAGTTPTVTGLSINNKGIFKWVAGQTFPGAGTITGVTAGTALTGGGTSGTVTLNLDTTTVPRLAAANSFSGAQRITNSASADALTITNNGVGAGENISTANGTGVFVSVPTANTGIFASGGLGIEGFSSTGTGVYGSSPGTAGNTAGVYGTSGAASGMGTGGRAGVWGDSTNNVAVYGTSKNQTGVLGQSGSGTGVLGTSVSSNGVYGTTSGTSGLATGSAAVLGDSGNYYGVWGTSAGNDAVHGDTSAANFGGVGGISTSAGYGVKGLALANNGQGYGVGVRGESNGTQRFPDGNGSDGVDGFAHSVNGSGVAGLNDSSGPGVYGYSASGPAGVFQGDVTVAGIVRANSGSGQSNYGSGAFITKSVTILGDLSIGGGLSVTGTKSGFFIDHPLDPANKYLAHTVIESPELKTMYDGAATLDGRGEAWVLLPDWFDALNRDCRYQLTSIGGPAPNLYIAQEVSGNRFKIAGGKPGGKVSWQVTGVRHDAYVLKHPFETEREKTAAEQGYYLNPDAYGQPEEKGIEWARHPELMRPAEEGAVKPGDGQSLQTQMHPDESPRR